MYVKEFFIILFNTILLITTFYFLFIGKINALGTGFIFVAGAIASALFWNMGDISKIKIAENEISAEIKQIKQIKEDIYAKAETEKSLTENVAEIIAYQVTRMNRYAGDDLQEKMLEARDRIIIILKGAETEKEKVTNIILPIENMVLSDLKREVVNKIGKIYDARSTPEKSKIDWNEINAEIQQLVENDTSSKSRDNLIKYLKKYNLYDPEIDPLIDRLDNFLKNKTL